MAGGKKQKETVRFADIATLTPLDVSCPVKLLFTCNTYL